jgi:hypothetical protein
MRVRWQWLLLAAVVLTCVGVAQTHQGHAALRDVGLYEAPATYTELAFSEPGKLPGALTKPNANINVSFTIHNVSSQSRSYQWSILLLEAGKSQVKATGAVSAPAQGQSEVTKSVGAACAGGRLQVTVRLASPAESISFWMTCPPAAKKQAKQ